MGGTPTACLTVLVAAALVLSACVEPAPATTLEAVSPVGQIQGVVHNDAGLPLAKVRISIVRTEHFSQTDAQGRFQFANITIGAHILRAEAQGFQVAEQTVNVTRDNVTETMFHLVPDADTGAGYRPHLHDLWGGADEVVIMDSAVSLTQPDSTGGIGGPLVYRAQATVHWPNSNQSQSDFSGYRIPVPSDADPPAIIYPGTKEIRVKLTWGQTDGTFHKVALRHRSPVAKQFTETARQVSGSTWTIPVQPNEADTGHQAFTLWGFFVNPYQDPARDGANYRPGVALGSMHVEIRIIKGQVVLEPPHEDFWKGGTELLLMDHAENTNSCNSAYHVVERETQACKKHPTRLVPPGTERLSIEFKWTYGQADGTAPSDLTLLYRTAAQHPYATRTSQFQIADCKTTSPQGRQCDIVLKSGETDAFYQRNSLWAFTYGVKGQERAEFDAEPRTLTFTLKIVAHRQANVSE